MTEELDREEAAEQVQEKRLIEALDRKGEVEQLKALLQEEPVRDLLWRILTHCNLYASTYNRNFGDMALMEGKRNVGLWLLSEICEADPKAEMRMRERALILSHLQKKPRRRP